MEKHGFQKKVAIICMKLFFIIADLAIINYFSTNAIVTNEMAMVQIESSNDAFIKLEFYNIYKNWAEIIFVLLCIWTIVSFIIDLVNYVKNKKGV